MKVTRCKKMVFTFRCAINRFDIINSNINLFSTPKFGTTSYKIQCFLFANDIDLLAKYPEDLQKLLKIAEQHH